MFNTQRSCVSSPHHVLPVQVVQHGAEQLRAGLVVGFTGVVVQLAAQLIGDQRQQNLSTLCRNRTADLSRADTDKRDALKL